MTGHNGLEIQEKQFLGMKTREQLLLLYKNQVETLSIVRSYKFHQKVQYVMIGLLGAGFVIIVNLVLR